MLEARGLSAILQLAVWMYNLDVAIGPVTVEVEQGTGNPLKRARVYKRTVYLLDRGWHVVSVAIRRSEVIEPGAADYVVALMEAIERNPPPFTQYRVIGSTGEFLAAGGLNGDKFAPIDPLIGLLDPPG
jgi:hypothetical protein